MIEYRTAPLEPAALLQELSFYCEVLTHSGITTTDVMFGWGSNMDIDEMWREMPVRLDRVVEFVLAAEQAGTVVVGKADIFVAAGGVEMTLCHESDVHISAAEDSAHVFFDRWTAQGYSPYAVESHPVKAPAG